MSGDDSYVTSLQVVVGVVMVCVALRFAFPRLRTAAAVLVTAALAAGAVIPGLPGWIRAAFVVLTLGASAALLMRRRTQA